MNFIRPIVVCLCAIFPLLGQSRSDGWHGIVSLHSTQTDVERLLGPPAKSNGVAFTYETKDERVLVFYSAGPCEKQASPEWNVPPRTVVSLIVHPHTTILVDSLNLDKSKYKRERDPHAEGIVYYFDSQEGIRISARLIVSGEDVDSISYAPGNKHNHLRCPCKKG